MPVYEQGGFLIMRSRTGLVLLVGFGALVALITLLGLGALRRARAIHDETLAAHDSYLRADASLRGIPADLYLAGLYLRDYLLDPSHLRAPMRRTQRRELQASAEQRLDHLAHRLTAADAQTLNTLREEVRAYWDAMDPLFDWSPAQKTALAYSFLRREVLPRGDAVRELASEIDRFNAQGFEQERQRLARNQRLLEEFLRKLTLLAIALGVVIAAVTVLRVSTLEKRAAEQRSRIEQHERELRKLSRRLVQAQEAERSALSRELHDAVGQMLTATGVDLANLETFRDNPAMFRETLEDARILNSETLRTVRNLAMGLRPSMLDDLGLGAALQWQGREFSRRSVTPVSVEIAGAVDSLAEPYRTCIFRVVQEALTNCARHARAKSVRVSLHGARDRIDLTVQDDGVGFEPQAVSGGLGLLGIEERVRELDGSLRIISAPGRGAILKVEVPLTAETPAPRTSVASN